MKSYLNSIRLDKMKVLLISNQRPNSKGVGNPIMFRMLNALKQDDRIESAEFIPFNNSVLTLIHIRQLAREFDLVHIHFGGLYALIIWMMLIGVKSQKLITFHGTDIHAKAIHTAKTWNKKLKIKLNQWASFISICIFDKCGFVAGEMMDYVPQLFRKQLKKKAFVHPLGVDYDVFQIISKQEAWRSLGLKDGNYVLFSDISNTTIKRRDLAQNIVKELGSNYELLIMSGVKPNEVPYYINASDFLLLTSDEEGSPNIIRECLALNKPVFSVDVGDAVKQLTGLKNSAVISRNSKDAALKIRRVLELPYTDKSREKCRHLIDFKEITKDVVRNIYCN